MYGNVDGLEQLWYMYRLKNESIQVCNKMNIRPLAKRVTSDIANTEKYI